MTTIEESTMTELPAMPPPQFRPLWLIVSYYVGPGRGSPAWKVHRRSYLSEDAALVAAEQLGRWHRHVRIVRVG